MQQQFHNKNINMNIFILKSILIFFIVVANTTTWTYDIRMY